MKLNPLFQILLGLVVLLAFGGFIQRGWHLRSQELFKDTPTDPRLVLKHATIVGWDLGKRLWEFSGDELVVDHENRYLNYKGHGVGKLFFNNKPLMTIYAPCLRYDLISKNAEAYQGVRLYANPRTVLSADELFWNQLSQRLYIPGKVTIKSPYGHFQGKRLLFLAYEGHLKLSDVRMNANFHDLHDLHVPPELERFAKLHG